jgi:SPP1 gp7 family putative phage head morphogenesis protein
MSQLLIAEINRILKLLESQLPASMGDPRNLRLERSFKKSLAEYFDGLEQAFPYAKLGAVYFQHAKEVSSPSLSFSGNEWDDWLEPLIRAFQADLLYRVNSHLAGIYLAGSAQMLSYGKTRLGIPIPFEGAPILQAVDWASQHCGQLVTRLDEETKKRLAQVISDGIQNKRGVDGISRDIRREFKDMSKRRADMIAQTETNTALSQASLDRMHDMGVTGKEWIVDGDERTCLICLGNASQGIIPIDQLFQSGHMQTPGHPGCRCATAPARLNRAD